MAQMFGYLHGSERVSSACLCEKNARLVAAIKMPRSRERTEASATPSPIKQLEQHMNSNSSSRQTAVSGAERPHRIQMSRQHPWRAENPDAVIVARGTSLGNPFRVYQHCEGPNGDWGVEDTGRFNVSVTRGWTKLGAIKFAIGCYEQALNEVYPSGSIMRAVLVMNLKGHDLACWCPLDQPCHADVLLEIANA